MKNFTFILFSLIIPFGLFSQENVIVEDGKLSLTDKAVKYYQKTLPSSVDLSGSEYLPPIYNQTHWVCNQVATSYYMMSFETNKMKGIASTSPENQYSVYFPWNFGNGGYGWYGDNYLITMELLKQIGVPFLSDCEADLVRDSSMWISGYDTYYQAMHNRIDSYLRISTRTVTGLLTLKSWIYDNCGGEYMGGTGTFLSNIALTGGDAHFAQGAPHEGEYVITKCGETAVHARTIVGYDDYVCHDYNGDGQYTNNVDLNGDGVLDVRDYEKGGFKIAESYGDNWQGEGYCWIMYKCMADEFPEGGILNNSVHIIKPKLGYSPELTAKIRIKHECRGKIKVKMGISSDVSSESWEYIQGFPIFNFQGGDKYMQGGASENDKTIEFGLDLTHLKQYFNEDNQARLFLVVIESDPQGSFEGEILEFTILDYTDTQIQEYSFETPTQIINDDKTVLYVNVSANECNKPRITTENIPVLSSINPIWYNLDCQGGTPPYKWEILPYFEVNHFNEEFDSFDGLKLTPDSTFNGCLELDLPFNFQYGKYYTDKLMVHSDGYILPFSNTNVWAQIRNYLYPIFINDNMIAPLARFLLLNHYESGDGIWYKFSDDNMKIRWKSSDKTAEAWTSANFGCELNADGSIIFSYGQINLKSVHSNIGGISFGNQSDNTKVWMDDVPENGTNIRIKPYPVPEGLHINDEGTLYGNPGLVSSYPFRVKVTDANNISHTVRYNLTTDLSEKITEPELFNIYPNPTTDYVIIDLHKVVQKKVQIKLIDNKGKLVFYDTADSMDSYYLRLDDVNNGIYFIELLIDGAKYHDVIVKM